MKISLSTIFILIISSIILSACGMKAAPNRPDDNLVPKIILQYKNDSYLTKEQKTKAKRELRKNEKKKNINSDDENN